MSEPLPGAAVFAEIIDRPQSLFDRVWQIAVSETPLDTPERRAGLKMRLLDMAATIRHPDVRAQYRKMLLDRYDAIFFSRRPATVKQSAQVVDMRSFLARRELAADDMALLHKLSCIEDDLAEATRLLGDNFTERGFLYQQDLVRARADTLRQIVEIEEAHP